MALSATPRVSVVIPVYNGEEFIADAIRSVLAQSYANWDLTICNNWSKDRTLAIAEELAAQDPRIRVVTYPKFVSVVESHNNAFNLISDEATYCVALGADDLLFPACLEEKVRVAETYPTVGMVGSYVLSGNEVIIPAYKFPDTIVRGREVGRFRFLQNRSLFGGPSSSLLRASIVRDKNPFYDPLNYYGDLEAYLDLLQHYDFGFVHQVLTYTRKGTGSRTTSYLERVNAQAAMRICEVTRFGTFYLTPDEFKDRLGKYTRGYYRFLGENVWEFRRREFWDYHLIHVKKLGHAPRYSLIAWYAFLHLLILAGNPLSSVNGFIRRVADWRTGKAMQQAESHGPAPETRSQGSAPAHRSSGPASTVRVTKTAP